MVSLSEMKSRTHLLPLYCGRWQNVEKSHPPFRKELGGISTAGQAGCYSDYILACFGREKACFGREKHVVHAWVCMAMELFALLTVLLSAALLGCSCLAQGESAQIYNLQTALLPPACQGPFASSHGGATLSHPPLPLGC
ncbi:hypothetical protein E2320_010822 [Naja naja]|nr:hypothetical protein E2320_010822 [Naja naja]